jgi:hypothetical protein
MDQDTRTREKLALRLTTLREANAFIAEHHRHHRPPAGHKFSLAVAEAASGRLVGVAVVGRPVARLLDDGHTLEVTRSCTDGTPNANSALYGAAWRTSRAMGARRLITYTQDGESGASLRAAGFRLAGVRAPKPGWDRPGRPREDKSPTRIIRTLWVIGANLDRHETLPRPVTKPAPAPARCVVCGTTIERSSTGRPRLTCSDRCRTRRSRRARSNDR